MTDTTLPPDGPPADRVEPVDIQQEMQNSYIDYAMSVIVGRALPDVRDGLKPVHRRVLYAMYELRLPARPPATPSRATLRRRDDGQRTTRTATQAIYDTLVRMAQPFSSRAIRWSTARVTSVTSTAMLRRPPCATPSAV